MFKCTIPWHQVHSQCGIAIITICFQNFSSSQILYPLNNNSPFLTPSKLGP